MGAGISCDACQDLLRQTAIEGGRSRSEGHLVHLSSGASLGGTERRLLELCSGLRERSWRVTLLLLDDGALHYAAHQSGQPAICLSLRSR